MATHTQPMLRDGALNEKVVFITGGGTGLGKAMGHYFLSLGAKLVITGRRLEVLEKTAEEWKSEGFEDVLPVACDVRHYDQVAAAVAAAITKFGKVDVLLNNAAGNFISPTERLSPNAFDAVIDIVLKGTKNCTLALGKHWIANKETNKNILNIVTTYAWTGSSFVVPSAMAKAGVLAMTRSLAVEWAKYGIRSNAIAPGPFPTKGAWDRLMPGDLAEQLDSIKQVPLRRVGEKQELANLAAYLISDYAAYMNGEVITIDGGEWLQDAGQFNFLDVVTPEQWDMLEMMTRNAGKK